MHRIALSFSTIPLWLFLAAQPSLAQDSTGKANLAAQKLLSGGAGLAAKFPGDANIATHADVIFADNFEEPEFGKRWDEKSDNASDVLSLDKPAGGAELGGHCLKVTARLGKNNGGGLTKWFEPAPALHFRFYTRFAEDCDYVHHFVTLRANKGLKGGDRWSGFGGAGLKPEGSERFSTAVEPWGDWGRNPPPGKWNFYGYWHEMKVSPDGKYWGNSFAVPDAPVIVRGRWVCVEFMLRHNTPGKPDGEQAFWIDGKLLGHWKGINWRKTAGLQANAITLESYVTDRWTKNPVNVVWFDNFVIARSYIGPAVAPETKR